MAESQNTRSYAQVADGEHYAHPAWFSVDISPKSGNLNIAVRWQICDMNGTPGNFDINGIEDAIPDGFDGVENVSGTYTIARADESEAICKCAGKPLEFIKDVAPKTYKGIKNVMEWCPDWDGLDPFWFYANEDQFKKLIVRVTVIHEDWEGKTYAKAKFTNAKDRMGKTAAPQIGIEDVQSRFGKFFRASATKNYAAKTETSATPSAPVAPAAPSPSPAPAPAPAAKPMTATKTDCWRAYCEKFGNAAGTDRWYDFTAKIGKDEADFTAEDWGRVFEDITFYI